MRLEPLKQTQKEIARHLKLTPIEGPIKTIAGFGCKAQGRQLFCAVAVFSYPDLKLLESKTIEREQPMPYIPGFMAFREGKLMLELYYQLEYDPDVLMVPGHGIAHPLKCGVASFLGHELHKPCIGVAKHLMTGATVEGEKIVMDNEVRGLLVTTKKHAKPVYVSPGQLITIEQAAELVQKTIVPPHKMPEPVHVASRFAKKAAKARQPS